MYKGCTLIVNILLFFVILPFLLSSSILADEKTDHSNIETSYESGLIGILSITGINLEKSIRLHKRLNLNYKTGLKWMRFDIGDDFYQERPLDFIPLLSSTAMTGTTGGASLNFSIDDEEKKTVYLGSTFGLVRLDRRFSEEFFNFTPSTNDTDWTGFHSLDTGLVLKLKKSTKVKINNSFLSVNPFSNPSRKYVFTVGIIHFLGKR